MLKISFTDFWPGFQEDNNLITNILKEIFEEEIKITLPRHADVCFLTICGKNHKRIIRKFKDKSFLFLGENIRPNIYDVPFMLSGDFNSYGGKNMRLPLWFLEIDWYKSNLGIIQLEDVEKTLVNYGKFTSDDLARRQDCITIFNNEEGTRMDMFNKLNSVVEVEAFGKPFNNWFPTYSDYRSKIKKMGNFKFNYCPENSLYPGYYTEKCFHAKVAGCIPIYFAESHVNKDFRKDSFINMYDYLEFEELANFIKEIKNDYSFLAKLANEPLLHAIPNLNNIKNFLYQSIKKIIN